MRAYLPALLFAVLAGPPTALIVWRCYRDIKHDIRELRVLLRRKK